MYVCGHGDVTKYCEIHNLIVLDKFDGNDITKYSGLYRVVVSAENWSESEYYEKKGIMLAKGYELISTKHEDTALSGALMSYYARNEAKRRCKRGGRCKFGFRKVNGETVIHDERMAVVKRIFELGDQGYTLRQIQADEDVHHDDGRKLAISTIQLILKNRKDYD